MKVTLDVPKDFVAQLAKAQGWTQQIEHLENHQEPFDNEKNAQVFIDEIQADMSRDLNNAIRQGEGFVVSFTKKSFIENPVSEQEFVYQFLGKALDQNYVEAKALNASKAAESEAQKESINVS